MRSSSKQRSHRRKSQSARQTPRRRSGYFLNEFNPNIRMKIQARESGICPARREVYSELMDEMIRQIALTGPETGALMVQIRDEINMSLSGYETIVASASGFGSLKALEAELGKEGKRDEVKQKQADVDKNKKEISELKVITV